MALVTLPRAVPTLEPVREAVIEAVNENMADALILVEKMMEDSGFVAVELEPPAAIHRAVIHEFGANPELPTLIVATWYARVTEPNQQLGANRWSGIVTLDYWARNDDEDLLAISLDRYAAALWAVIIDADERNALQGAKVLYETMEMEASQVVGETPNERGVRIQFQVTFRT